MPLPEFGHGWVLLLDVAGCVWNPFGVKPFLGLLAGGAFGVAKKNHGGMPPVVRYLVRFVYAIAVWKTMGFAAIPRSSAFLPQQNRFADPVGNQFPVTGGVVFQQRLHHLRKLFPGKRGDFQLLSVQIFHGVDLPVKGGFKGPCFGLRNQRFGDDFKGTVHHIGKQSCTLVEDGAIVKTAVSGNDRNVVEMSVVVEDKTVNFKQQSQVLGEQGQAGDVCGFLSQVGHSLFVAGYAA